MNLFAKLRAVAVFTSAGAIMLAPSRLTGQDQLVRRLANTVSVAVEEYGKGVDEHGRLTSETEYKEAVDFLADARQTSLRLPGERLAARALLDSIIAAVQAKRSPSVLAELEQRFAAALGSEAALELPKKPLDVAAGKKLYETNCASCHGPRAMGDGPQARLLNPKPPALADQGVGGGVSPGMMFRKMSVGVAGTAMPPFAATMSAEDRWNVIFYLSTLRSNPAQIAEGEGLYAQMCASCHGLSGTGEGTVARSLSKLPPELGTLAWQAQRSDSQMANVIVHGMPGSPMPGATSLTSSQVQSIVAYARTLPLRERTMAVAARDTITNRIGGPEAASRHVLSLLDQALTAAKNGRMNDAKDLAFDAYLAFEPIESPAKARDPGVVFSMEKLFGDFKGSLAANDIRGAERAANSIDTGMPRILALTRPTGSGSEAFLQSFLIILREGFEAILVIGAVVAFLLKTGHRERLRSIWTGIALALACSAVTAIALKTILGAIPASREIIEGTTLLIAVGVLFSVSYWLISRVEAAKWQAFIRDKVNTALEHGGGKALAFVSFLAVYREGAETALFYQALFNEGPHVALPISLGIIAGFAALAVIFTLFYRFGVKIPLRPFFSVTSVLLYYMAFVFLGKGITELQEGNALPINPIPGFPRIDNLGLFPTWQAVWAQLILLALFVFAVAKSFWPKRSVTLPTMEQPIPAVADVTGELAALRDEIARLKTQVAELQESDERIQESELRSER